MIKKLSLWALGVMSSAVVCAQQPELKWMSAQDGVGLEIGIEITEAADGNALILNRFQSSAKVKENEWDKNYSQTTDYWTFDMATGEKISEKVSSGFPDTESANGGENMTLYKVDNNGHLIWGVSTTLGDFAGAGTMTATPDNGVMLMLKMRVSSKGQIEPNVLCQIKDAQDKLTTVEWECPDYQTYGWVSQPVLVKIDENGNVVWAKQISVQYFSSAEKGTSHNWSNNYDMNSITADEQGNVYVTGRTNTDIDFGSNVKLTNIRNANGWDGDTQKTRGDLFVVKFNSKGEAQWVTTSAGDPVECESPQSITYANNTLYISGYMKGNNTSVVQLGNSKIVPSTYKSLFAASLSAEDGQFKWARMYNSAKSSKVSKPYAKPMCITVDGDEIFLGGSFQGNIIDGNDEEKVLLTNDIKPNLSAYLLKCSAQDGSFIAGVDPIKNPIAELQAIHIKGDVVVASGYNLMTSSYTFIMDRDLTEDSIKTFSIKDNPMGTTQGSVLIGEDLISLTRGKNTVTIPGLDWQYEAVEYDGKNNWCILYLCHSLKDFLPTTGIENAEMSEATFNVYSQDGGIVVETSETCQLRVYNVLGALVYNEVIEAGNTTIALPKGIYIVNGKKAIVF